MKPKSLQMVEQQYDPERDRPTSAMKVGDDDDDEFKYDNEIASF